MDEVQGEARPVEAQLVAGRPRFDGALDALQAHVLAGLASRAPRRVGRYRLGPAIGSGAFGTVHEADDPELQRKVAIKLFAAGPARETERVLREARMLATVSSPNVVAVFEVGQDDATRAPYLVMELVEGPTLRAYLGEARRPWREVVEIVLAAARGLLAAHRGGVVHRDFKPDNVILASDGRPRVVDFGLARAVADTDPGASATFDADPRDPTLTPSGTVMGTPAYMAPECFSAPCTPASDQYALCVTLFEGLFGARPFQATTAEELFAQIVRDDPEVPRDRRGVPAAVIAAALTGLHRDPTRRHRDLGALIVALERAVAPRRSGVAIGLGAVGFAAVLASASLVAGDDRCATGEAAWRRLGPASDDFAASQAAYAARWQAAEQALCDTTQITAAQRHCLDRRLDDVVAVREILAELAPEARAALDDPFRSLPDPQDCTTPADVGPADRIVADGAAVHRVEAALSRLRALMITSNPAEGLPRSTELLVEARGLHHGPLVAEVAYVHARMLLLASQYAEAAAAFEESFHAAQAAGLDRDAAHAASDLVRVHGYFLGDHRAARRWAEHAASSFARAGIDPSTNGVYSEGIAGLAEREGDPTRAATVLREAIASATANGRARDGMTGGLQNHLGAVLLQLDQPEPAVAAFTEAISILTATNGPGSMGRASALDNLGVALVMLGRYDEALARHREALAIREAGLDADHLDLGASLGNMAEVLERLGRHDEAEVYVDRAIVLFTRRLGADHPHVATALEIRGRILAHRTGAAKGTP